MNKAELERALDLLNEEIDKLESDRMFLGKLEERLQNKKADPATPKGVTARTEEAIDGELLLVCTRRARIAKLIRAIREDDKSILF